MLIKGVRADDSISVFFPAFNFTFVLISLFFGLGINIAVFRKFRINYIFIFEIEPKARLGQTEILKVKFLIKLDSFIFAQHVGYIARTYKICFII
jgi:hypothetical protein